MEWFLLEMGTGAVLWEEQSDSDWTVWSVEEAVAGNASTGKQAAGSWLWLRGQRCPQRQLNLGYIFSDSDRAAQCTLLSHTLCPGHLVFSSAGNARARWFLFFLPQLNCKLKCVGLQLLPSPGAEGCGFVPTHVTSWPCLQCSFLGV